MAEWPGSVPVREHAAYLWRALLQVRMPNSWVPVPVKRALMEAIAASLVAMASTRSGSRVSPREVWEAARMLGADEGDAPRPGERLDQWLLRVLARRPGETASEWVERASKIAVAVLARFRVLTASAEDLMPATQEEEEVPF